MPQSRYRIATKEQNHFPAPTVCEGVQVRDFHIKSKVLCLALFNQTIRAAAQDNKALIKQYGSTV